MTKAKKNKRGWGASSKSKKKKRQVIRKEIPAPRLFHYTTGIHLLEIIKAGKIQLADTEVPDSEKQYVWMTMSEKFEKTACKNLLTPKGLVFLNKKGTHKFWGGVYRLEIPMKLAQITWNEYKISSGVDPMTFASLTRAAQDKNSDLYSWRACDSKIDYKDVICIERMVLVGNSEYSESWEICDQAENFGESINKFCKENGEGWVPDLNSQTKIADAPYFVSPQFSGFGDAPRKVIFKDGDKEVCIPNES